MKTLSKIENATALDVFASDDGLDHYVQLVRDEVEGFVPDVATSKGRKEIASLANNVARVKVKLDGFGKDLVAEWKQKAKAVDSNRRRMRDSLDELKITARAPLTKYEAEIAAEAKRRADEEERERVRAEIDELHEFALLYLADFDRKLRDAAELKEKAERERQEREKVELAEREAAIIAQAQREAKESEARAVRDKIAADERAEKAKADAEQEKLLSIARQVAAEERRIEELKAAEARRIAELKAAEERRMADAAAIEKRVRADELARKAAIEERENKARLDRKRVGEVRRAAKEALMHECKIDNDAAREVVLAISAGKIPGVVITYKQA